MMTNPTLTDIKGIGPAVAQKLQAQGVTVEKLSTMTAQQLTAVPGIGLVSAKAMIASAKTMVVSAQALLAGPVPKGGAVEAVKKTTTSKAPKKDAKKSDKKSAKKAAKKAVKKAAKKASKKSSKKKKKSSAKK